MFEFKQSVPTSELKHNISKSNIKNSVAICYLVLSIFFTSVASQNIPNSNYGRSPPGVPPRQHFDDGSQQNHNQANENIRSPVYQRGPPGVPPRLHQQEVPTASEKDTIKFHDPSEYQKVYDAQKNIEKQHQDEHRHGMGEAIDAEHMKQHTKEKYVDFSKMSQAEIAIHHFRQFDLDDNGRVDGLEVFKKIRMDAAEHGDEQGNNDNLDVYLKIVDNALNEYDENKDGYIYYAEFYKAYSKL